MQHIATNDSILMTATCSPQVVAVVVVVVVGEGAP